MAGLTLRDDGDARVPVAILAVLGFGLRVALIHAYPPIFGGDSVTRLVHHDRILLAYQLPALQASVHALMNLTGDPLWVRYWIAAIGAVAGVGFYLLAADLFGRRGAFYAALLFVSHPFVLAHSTVPYQEILMLAGLFFAFHFFFSERWMLASLALGVACLTRYEAWAACPVLAVTYAARHRWRPMEGIKALALFVWAPAAWILINAGIAPAGTFVVESRLSPARLVRYLYLGWITAKFTPIPVLLLAGVGLWRGWRLGVLASARLRVVAAFVTLFLLAILFSAHGESRDPERFVTSREAHIPIVAVLLLAGLGLPRFPRVGMALAAAGFALGLLGTARFLAAETSEPRLQLAVRIAAYLDGALGPAETALILAPPVPEERIHGYLDRARRSGGDKGVESALAMLRERPPRPPDFGRIVAHCHAGKRIRALPSASVSAEARRAELDAPRPDWIVVWSDFTAADEKEQRLYRLATASGPPVETLHAGPLSAGMYRLPAD